MMWWWILVPVILVLAIFMYASKNSRGFRKKENPVDTLKKRFANGEISKEEYEEQKKTLNTKN